MAIIDLGDLKIGAQAALAAVGSVERGLESARTAVQTFGTTARAALNLADDFLGAAAAAEQHQRALTMLGDAYARVQTETNGAVTAEQALRMQQELTQSGLRVSSDELATLARTAREASNNSLQPLDQVLGQLTEALRSGAPDAMRRFGVSVHEGTTRGQAMDQMLRQLRAQQSGLTPQTQTLAEAQRGLHRALGDATDAMINMVTRGGGLVGLVETLTARFHALAVELNDPQFTNHLLGRDEHGQARDAANQASNERYTGALQTLAGAGMTGLPRAHLLNDAQRNRISELAALYTRLEFGGATETQLAELRGQIGTIASGYGMHGVLGQLANGNTATGALAAVGPVPAAGTTGPRDRAGRGGGGGAPANPQEALDKEIRAGAIILEQRRMLLEYNRIETPLIRGRGETQDHYDTRWLAHLQQQNEALREQSRLASEPAGAALRGGAGQHGQQTADALSGGMRGTADDMARLEQSQQRAADTQRQFRDAFQLNADQTLTAAQRMAQGTRGAYDAMSGAATSHFRLLLQHREDLGQALAGMAHDMTESLATQAFGQMLWETAQGIAALAGVATAPLAPGHFAAAAAYAAVAALAGGIAYASAPSAGGAGTAATQATPPGSNSAFATAGGSGGAGGGGNVTYQVIINGALDTKEAIGDHVRGIVNQNARRGQFSYEERRARRHVSPA